MQFFVFVFSMNSLFCINSHEVRIHRELGSSLFSPSFFASNDVQSGLFSSQLQFPSMRSLFGNPTDSSAIQTIDNSNDNSFPQFDDSFAQSRQSNSIRFDPIPISMPAMNFDSNFSSQTWDLNKGGSRSIWNITAQLNSIFRENSELLSPNFVKKSFDEAWNKSVSWFGDTRMGFDSLDFGSPGSLSNMFAQTQPQSIQMAKSAFALEEFSKTVKNRLHLNTSDVNRLQFVASGVRTEPLKDKNKNLVPQQPVCQLSEIPVIPIEDFLNPDKQPACAQEKYRTHTGECNNIVFPNRGKESTIFSRFLKSDYADGISEPRQNSQKTPLPSARLVSSSLVGTKIHLAPTWTTLFTEFGQFLDHDLTSTPRITLLNGEAPKCCDTPNPHPECLPIIIPDDDPFFSKFGQKCMEFVRSLPGNKTGCSRGPQREQINQVTAYIDGSMIYGSRKRDAQELRAFQGGFLKISVPDEENSDYTVLPGLNNKNLCIDGTPSRPCFKAGDDRCNVQPGLQTMHTVWARHHNNLADRLSRLNPNWDDEKLYQEARAIVWAQLQHIVFHEWLPILLGEDVLVKEGLRDLSPSERSQYNVTLNIGLFTEFTTAAFRVGHAMVVSKLDHLDSDFNLLSSDRLQETYMQSQKLYDNSAVDELVRGMTRQEGKQVEANVVSDLSHKLFIDDKSRPFGLDLISLNIQRGRDHGIPGYMKIRQLCNLPIASNFDDMKTLDILPEDVVTRMASIYDSVEDIDLYVAGISEPRKGDGIIGETFSCIITEQFWRLRIADRFWYENDLQLPSSFSDGQLKQLRKTSFAKILCDAIPNLQVAQPKVFETINDQNQATQCDDIPGISLRPWRGV